MSDTNDSETSGGGMCDIEGCINDEFNHGFCRECLHRMSLYDLHIRGARI